MTVPVVFGSYIYIYIYIYSTLSFPAKATSSERANSGSASHTANRTERALGLQRTATHPDAEGHLYMLGTLAQGRPRLGRGQAVHEKAHPSPR